MNKMLFSPLKLREVVFRNRITVSPMCQYSSEDGFANNWHLVHLGSRAVGGAALVTTEATAVEPRGRISPQDLGIWKDDHLEMLKQITTFIESQGALAGIQLAHAGRKASTRRPWDSGPRPVKLEEGGWIPVAPTSIPYDTNYPVPIELTRREMQVIEKAFQKGVERAYAAGFKVVEIHAAHGYLIHEFLSPLSNQRKDDYGGSLENRMKFPLEIVKAARKVWPEKYPLFVRISATDWVSGGWDLEQSVVFSKKLKEEGVDLIVCSSGGMVSYAEIPDEPGYQVPFSDRIRNEVGIPTAALGLITEAPQAEKILQEGKADLIAIARGFLRDPYWPLMAASRLQIETSLWPAQYLRAKG
ncbi:MAG: NADH:flavin oxidoreductase/NADH oxidase [Firmicutes bacterium]|jgi:2,4-dienoyl-CoA reductase-like NADH-dependent reductase (Old Yellow Enzyme family)|nr:NADH:flavin oxidoreductase/NADH oxidase [Bacillota bacterium]